MVLNSLFLRISTSLNGFIVWSACVALAVACWAYVPLPISMEEICDNALDDDMDGLIDLNDPDCDCEEIETVSLIPNPSFEELDCCPSARSQLDCAIGWIQASEPTTDLIHQCDWLGWPDFPPPVPFPDGQGIMGFRDGRVRNNGSGLQANWKEYAGACLLSPLEADSLYRFQFDLGFVNHERSPPIRITFFGTPDCNNLPFGVGNEDFGCPTNGPNWIELGSQLVSGDGASTWVNVIMEVTPELDIAAIAIGPDCPAVNTDVSLYYFFDNLILADINSFDFEIREVSHPCQPDFSLQVPLNNEVSYQWYMNGIALVGETNAQLSQIYGEGDYQVRIDDGTDCRVSVPYAHQVPVISRVQHVTVCADETYLFGDQELLTSGRYVDTFTSVDNCDSIVTLNLEILGALSDTVSARIFEGETYRYNDQAFRQQGEHVVTLTSSQGCDSLVLLVLDFYQLYIPNVFSPNLDGINDHFRIYSESGLVENIDLTIYDRWGAQVATGSEWDGRRDGQPVNPGVFVYVARIRMSDGVERLFSGSVTVLK